MASGVGGESDEEYLRSDRHPSWPDKSVVGDDDDISDDIDDGNDRIDS